MKSVNELIEMATKATHENGEVDFKRRFDINLKEDWCEILKDIVAMANSGGGVIIFGINDDTSAADFDATGLLRLDPAKVTDKIAKFTGRQFADFQIEGIDRDGRRMAAILVFDASIPLIFTKAGIYQTQDKRHKIAFREGTIYFRHGAKSEPANSDDLRNIIEREIEKRGNLWIGNLRQNPDIFEILSKIKSQSVPLSQSIAEALTMAIKLNNPDLERFCKYELIGWTREALSELEASKEPQPIYRLIDAYVTLSKKAKLGSRISKASELFDYMKKHTDRFIPYAMFIRDSVSKIETRMQTEEDDEIVITNVMNRDINSHATNPDAPAFVYFRADSYSKVLKSIRTELIKRLLDLLPKIGIE